MGHVIIVLVCLTLAGYAGCLVALYLAERIHRWRDRRNTAFALEEATASIRPELRTLLREVDARADEVAAPSLAAAAQRWDDGTFSPEFLKALRKNRVEADTNDAQSLAAAARCWDGDSDGDLREMERRGFAINIGTHPGEKSDR